jgi:carbonic anhydrase
MVVEPGRRGNVTPKSLGPEGRAMQRLIDGLHQFQKEDFHRLRGLFQELAHGQKPETLFITCSDSRIDPNLLTKSRPGDLFVLRNAGNFVPSHGAAASGQTATVEYAVLGLGVKDIVVCGHSQCGAMAALLKPEKLAGMPAMQAWLHQAEGTHRMVREQCRGMSWDELLLVTIKANVLAQIENLQSWPEIAARRAQGSLRLHGWVYQFETGSVLAYESQKQEFVPL